MQYLENAISPYEEMLAYELIWALPEMTLKSITELFSKNKELPSKIVRSHCEKLTPELDFMNLKC
jgi:hypothetical protein